MNIIISFLTYLAAGGLVFSLILSACAFFVQPSRSALLREMELRAGALWALIAAICGLFLLAVLRN